MRIKAMDKVFGMSGLGEIVARNVADPASNTIKISEVIDALHKEKKEEGVSQLFQNCIQRFGKEEDKKRLLQIAEGAFRCYKILKQSCSENVAPMEEQLQLIFAKEKSYHDLFKKIISKDIPDSSEITTEESTFVKKELQLRGDVILETMIEPTKVEMAEAEEWLLTQQRSLSEIMALSSRDDDIKELNKKVKQFAGEHERKSGFTTFDAKVTYANKTLYGRPFDQNRLGRVGEKEVVYANGEKERKNVYESGFDDFYYAGSSVKLPERNYLLVQAPLVQHEDKVDTVQDFWDAVVVLEKSPIIVTVHDPKEKIPRHGYPQRAEYWTDDRFDLPMKLRGGWELAKAEPDYTIAVSRYSNEIKIVKRSFIAKHPENGGEHRVSQFHYEGWPDNCGAPDHELLETLHKAVEQELLERKVSKEAPITVHCAAGQGRTPVFAISNYFRHIILSRIVNGEKIDEITLNVPEIVFEGLVA